MTNADNALDWHCLAHSSLVRGLELFEKNSRLALTMPINKDIMMEIDKKLRSVAGLIVEMSDRGVNGNSHVELEVAQKVCKFVSELIFQDVRNSNEER